MRDLASSIDPPALEDGKCHGLADALGLRRVLLRINQRSLRPRLMPHNREDRIDLIPMKSLRCAVVIISNLNYLKESL